MNTPVDFYTAKLLKEKGFDEPCRAAIVSMSAPFYSRGLTTNTELSKEKISTLISAPTIAEVVMWLYKKHGIWITCVVWEDAPHFLSKIFIMNNFTESKNIGSFNSPTEAYEAAILYTLNNLIQWK